ncbi:EpsG family protein [Rosenbergiella metrosideri]|uniref:EpsG family protein n=1 Tax=Rosenbergiella metrosideri TaxID=2921185 RepID=UPI001F4F2DFC
MNFLFVSSVVAIIIFAGARGVGTGYDDLQYRYAFNEIAEKSVTLGLSQILSLFRYEPITTLLMYITSLFSKSADVLLMTYATISIMITSLTYKKVSPYILISLCIFSAHLLINKDMNQIRFGIASALYVYSLTFLSEKKIKLFIVIYLLSVLSHQTATAGLLVVFSQIYKRKYLPFYIVVLSVLLGLIGSKFFLGKFENFIPQTALAYEGSEYDTELPIFSISNFKNIVFVYIYCKYLINNDSLKIKWEIRYILVFAFSIGAGIRIFFNDFSIIGGRVGNLFLQIEPILISMLIFEFKKYKVLMLTLCLMIVIYYLLYNTIINPQSIHGYVLDNTFNIF